MRSSLHTITLYYNKVHYYITVYLQNDSCVFYIYFNLICKMGEIFYKSFSFTAVTVQTLEQIRHLGGRG